MRESQGGNSIGKALVLYNMTCWFGMWAVISHTKYVVALGHFGMERVSDPLALGSVLTTLPDS